MRGLSQVSIFKDSFIAPGAGVGGASLVHADTPQPARDVAISASIQRSHDTRLAITALAEHILTAVPACAHADAAAAGAAPVVLSG